MTTQITMTELQVQTLRQVVYFWQEKGDLERMSDWKKLSVQLQETHPELLMAWNNYMASRRILDAVIETIGDAL